MDNLPFYIALLFGLTTLITIAMLYSASRASKATMIILLLWMAVQGFIARSGFYTVTNTVPPRFMLLVLPPVLLIIALFATPKGRAYIDSLNIKRLTLLHTIRVPVEIVLFWLFVHKAVPKLMTFEGRNFDIISGLSAPFIFYYGFVRRRLTKSFLLGWNFICLALLINIVVNAVFSLPVPFQKFAFNQPNIAVLYFPFNWLPSVVVPIVFLSHLAAIRQLLRGQPRA